VALDTAPYRSLCTDCGISRTSNPKRCGDACQFIKPKYPELETQVHGRPRDLSRPDELHFGPFTKMLRAGLKNPSTGAQWTGITTRIGERLLETGAVDAILTMTEDLPLIKELMQKLKQIYILTFLRLWTTMLVQFK
jgi:coenzyme F420 hydrogenase subunit beta